MGFHAGQRDAGQIEGIDPSVLEQRIARRMLRREIAVELGIMGHDDGVSYESGQIG